MNKKTGTTTDLEEALGNVIARLKKLPRDEFRQLIDKHQDGDIAKLLEYGWTQRHGEMENGMLCARCGYGWWSFDQCCSTPVATDTWATGWGPNK